jgi:hypothetical protein
MKLEQVLPLLRDGNIITRKKPFKHDDKSTILFVKIEESKLKFKVIWSTGEVTGWAFYHLRTEDVMAENWEVV